MLLEMAKGVMMKKTAARAARHVLIILSSITFQAGKHINNLQRAICMFPNAFPAAVWNCIL